MVDDVEKIILRLELGQIGVGEACIILRTEWVWLSNRCGELQRGYDEVCKDCKTAHNELSHMTDAIERYEAIIDRLLDRD